MLADGLACFPGVTEADCTPDRVVVGNGRDSVLRPELRWLNTLPGNVKKALRGMYHAVRPCYAQCYLAEFKYRFNRRFDLPGIVPGLLSGALRISPMSERRLKLSLF